MSIALDLSISPSDMMYRLLTQSTTELPTGSSLTANDIAISDITAVSGRDDGANTEVTLTPVTTSTLVYGPAVQRYYIRKSLTDAATQANFSLAITDDLSNWSSDKVGSSALAEIQTFYSFITADDILVAAPVTNSDGTLSVVVTMADGHWTLTGSATLVITSTETRTSSDDIPSTLDGLS